MIIKTLKVANKIGSKMEKDLLHLSNRQIKTCHHRNPLSNFNSKAQDLRNEIKIGILNKIKK